MQSCKWNGRFRDGCRGATQWNCVYGVLRVNLKHIIKSGAIKRRLPCDGGDRNRASGWVSEPPFTSAIDVDDDDKMTTMMHRFYEPLFSIIFFCFWFALSLFLFVIFGSKFNVCYYFQWMIFLMLRRKARQYIEREKECKRIERLKGTSTQRRSKNKYTCKILTMKNYSS